MRILLIVHAPWKRELGLSCCSIELAEEFRALGHHVDKFDLRDAFPRQTRLGSFFEHALFARRAVELVRRHGRDYDVIQAEQGNLPVTKEALRFDGTLVCRSDGLAHIWVDWLRDQGKRSSAPRGTLAGDVLRRVAGRLHGGVAAVDRSFEAADAIVLLNRDELDYVTNRLGHGAKAVLLPNGLSEARFRALETAARPAGERLRERHVVLVGHLSERKGLFDVPEFVRELRRRVPEARLSLLGSAMAPDRVLGLFDARDRQQVRVVQEFAWEQLPELLADATAGILPSYVEGFPLGVLEQLAAGVPTVAYDAFGSSEVLRPLAAEALTPAGDPLALAARVAGVLELPEGEYAACAERARACAGRYRWRDIARETLAVYEAARSR
jgi:glycosyltransferase involved in cell wall biosynthesis